MGPFRINNNYALGLISGNRLVPWITSPLLPAELTIDQPEAKALRLEFEKIVIENDLKFQDFNPDYNPYRILIIDVGQSGLNLDYHAGRFKGGKGILLTWMDTLCERIKNINAIYLNPGIGVETIDRKIVAGHKYVDRKPGYYDKLWSRDGVQLG
jgi:hypothetical protein